MADENKLAVYFLHIKNIAEIQFEKYFEFPNVWGP